MEAGLSLGAESGHDRRKGGGHLPPGHDPGPQSRRVARGRPLGVIIVGLLDLGFLIAAVVLLLVANSAKSPTGARIGAAIFGGVAILFSPVVILLWRTWRPRQARYLQLEVEPIELRRGDTVRVTLTITDAHKIGEELDLGLVCTQYYDYTAVVQDQHGSHRERKTMEVESTAKWTKPNRSQLRQTVQFTVPADAPFSFEGGAVSWAWHVSARDRHPHRYDAHRTVPVWVSL